MLDLTDEQKHGLNVALNEAALVGVEVDPDQRFASITLSVLTLPPDEGASPPDDPRVLFLLHPVGRVAASFRLGSWNDPAAPVKPFTLDQLLTVVQGFQHQAIYGWEFIDLPDDKFKEWSNRLSLDFRSGSDGLSHTLDLFQDDSDQFLELRIWFDDLTIRDPSGADIPLDEFIAGGRRWWDAMYRGDSRTQGSGIIPLKPGTKINP